MAIFRLQENVPDVYVRKSRDFQLLCNAFDAIVNAVKFDIDSIPNTADTRLCPDALLPLLQNKLGFFTNKEFTANELRTVLQAFKYVVRDKGSRVGIQAAIQVFLKLADASNKSRINIIDNYQGTDGIVKEDIVGNTYIVEVAIEGRQIDTTLLTELLKYVLPAGYKLVYSFYTSADRRSYTYLKDTLQIAFIDVVDARGVRAIEYDITEVDEGSPDSTIFKYGDQTNYPYRKAFVENTYYTFNAVTNDYTLLTTKPVGWPNGEYFTCTTRDVYVPVDMQWNYKFVYPSNQYKYYYVPDGADIPENRVYLTTEPDVFPSSLYRYEDRDTGSTGDVTEEIITPIVFEPNKYYYKQEGTYSLADKFDYRTEYYYTMHQEKVYTPEYLQLNSIHGVGTTSTKVYVTDDSSRDSTTSWSNVPNTYPNAEET